MNAWIKPGKEIQIQSLAKTCVNSSNKKTEDKLTLTADYPKGPIVYYEDSCGSRNCLPMYCTTHLEQGWKAMLLII